MPTTTSIDVQTPDGTADATLVRPDGEPRGAVLFVMDAFGLRPRIDEMAEHIAAQGYVVLAPNVLYRGGRTPLFEMPDLTDPEQRSEFFGKARPLISALGPDAARDDGGAYLETLAAEAPGPVGITGYCMGARFGFRIAAAHPDRVAALGGFHAGGLVTDGPDSPHRAATDVRAEVLFGHADQDPSLPPEQIEALDKALDEAGVTHTTEVYAGAQHGYTMADTAAYDAAATERHFTELFALLDRTLS